MKKQMLIKQGFSYNPMKRLWMNGVVRKAVSQEAVDDCGVDELRSWIHALYPADQQWAIRLTPGSAPGGAEQIAADLGWK
jgi:hypothetical protein